MQGLSIRITAPDGRTWTLPFEGMQMSVGRLPDNNIVLEQHGVSSHHCVIGRDPTGALLLQDRGSTNGTWIGDRKVEGVVPIQPGTKITVGSYLLTLEGPGGTAAHMQAPGRPLITAARPMVAQPRGPLLRKSDEESNRQRVLDRVRRYAQEWDQAGRPARLLLRGRNLARALELLDHAGDADEVYGELEESFVRASAEGRERGKVIRIASIAVGAIAAVGLIVGLVMHDWGGDEELAVVEDDGGDGETGDEGEDGSIELRMDISSREDDDEEEKKEDIEHTVIPAETLEEIGLRYDVPIQSLMRWNGIDESTPLEPGRKLKVTTAKRPLPQQQIVYRPDKKESWSSLAQRFDVPVAKLRAYNPGIEGEPNRGAELTVWIDPKPLQRKENVQIPEFEVRPDAISVGAPRDGQLLNGINFPADDALYKRRKPYIMWCSSHMAKHLRGAIAAFRYTYEFEGEIVVADMSQQHGGHFPPHKSHQAGRDVDIWLPSLKGVYQQNHLNRDRRPNPEEADWFALYGFLKALHETGEVQQVFLAYELHDRVYQAAKLMGANDKELEEMIAYPRGAHWRSSLLQHSPGHTHHIHVRFKCGPNDQCSKTTDNDPGD
jgi:LysM repeat protein